MFSQVSRHGLGLREYCRGTGVWPLGEEGCVEMDEGYYEESVLNINVKIRNLKKIYSYLSCKIAKIPQNNIK